MTHEHPERVTTATEAPPEAPEEEAPEAPEPAPVEDPEPTEEEAESDATET